jgi:hypothetical protein
MALSAAQTLLSNLWKMITQGCERKRFLPNLGSYPETRLKGLRETMRNVKTAGLNSEPETFWILSRTRWQNVRIFKQLVNSGQGFVRKRPWHYLRYWDVPIVSVNGEKTANILGIFCVPAEILRDDLPNTIQTCLKVRIVYVNLQLPVFGRFKHRTEPNDSKPSLNCNWSS